MPEFSSGSPSRNRTSRSVVFVESAAAMGGIQFSTLYLCQYLIGTQWQPIIVCPAEGDLPEAARRSDIPVHILDYPRFYSTSVRIGRKARLPNPAAWIWNLWATLLAARSLSALLRQLEPEIVITKGLFSHFYGGLAANRLHIPCVWHLQDFLSERWFKIYPRLFGWASRRWPDYIIVDGASIRSQLPRSVHDRICVILNGVDTNIFQSGLDGSRLRRECCIPPEAMVIGHVARMTPWKGQHFLLEAFAKITRSRPDIYLLFVGAPVFDNDSFERKLVERTARLGLNNRVKFAGYRHDMPEVLAAMDIFAFTSTEKDTSPLALLSAMSSGLPIVAFAIEGVREIAKTEEPFLLVPVGQAEPLAEALTMLLSSGELRQRLASCARQKVEVEFSLNVYASRIKEVLTMAADADRPTAECPPLIRISEA